MELTGRRCHLPERKDDSKMEPKRFLKFLKFGVFYFVVAARLFGLFLYSVWLLDCFLRESHMRVLCDNFSLFPKAEVIASIWLMMISLTSICCLLYIRRLPQFSGYKRILKHMLRTKYFYKISVVIVLVLIYDFILLSYEIQLKKTLLSSTFMLEHITSVMLMLTLNFVPKFVKNTGSRWNMVGITYKVTLVIYSLENYTLFLLETIAAAYHIIVTPSCLHRSSLENSNSSALAGTPISPTGAAKIGETACRDVKSASMMVLHLTLIFIRHLTGEFFLTKIFQENADILHEVLKPIDSLGAREENDNVFEGRATQASGVA